MNNFNIFIYSILFIVTGNEDDNLIFYEDTSIVALNNITITETKKFGGLYRPSINNIYRN